MRGMFSLVSANNVDPATLTNALLSPFTVIGTITAFTAGVHAAWELSFGTGASDDLQTAINFGIARGFIAAAIPSIVAFIGALASL
jgi:hypothetical protein